MVSYTRARAEALGVECKVGIATRPVRVVILSIGLVFARGASLGDFAAARSRPSTCSPALSAVHRRPAHLARPQRAIGRGVTSIRAAE